MKFKVEVYFCYDDYTWTHENFYDVDCELDGHLLNDAVMLQMVKPQVAGDIDPDHVVLWGVYSWDIVDPENEE